MVSKASVLGLLVNLTLVSSHNDYDEKGWHEAGKYLTEYMDSSKNPCETFNEHVCGNFGDPTSDQHQSDRSLQEEKIMRKVEEIINHIDPENPETSSIEKGVRNFYENCLQTRGRNFDNDSLEETISSLTNKIFDPPQGNAEKTNLWGLVGRIKREIGDDLGGFRFYMKKVGEEPRGVIYGSPFRPNNVTRVLPADIPSLVPNIDWNAYFQEIIPEDVRDKFFNDQSITIDLPDVQALREISLKDFGGAKTEEEARNYLKEKSRDGIIAFQQLLTSNETFFDGQCLHFWNRSIDDQCLHEALCRIPAAIARLYFKSIGQDLMEWRHDIKTLTRNLVAAFQFLLNNVDWMEDHDLEKIKQKVDNLTFSLGIPDWIYNDTAVLEDISDFTFNPEIAVLENELKIQKIRRQRNLKDAILGIKRDAGPTFELNANYNEVQNRANLFLGYFLPPRYHINYPLAVKYGSFGTVIAHEIIHAFDSEGILRPHANLEGDWLEDKTIMEYKKRSNCLVRQFSSYCIQEHSTCVNGSLTLAENIADIDGLKVAFTAYKFASQVFGKDPPIPDLLNNTQDQLFFLAYARSRCSRGYNKDHLLNDEHSPPQARVDVALRNVRAFARAFQCPMGSTYAPLKICNIWEDMADPANNKKRK